MGASAQQTVDAFREAEQHEGPSLILAYGHCIAHGIDMRLGLTQQKLAVDCGHWPLYRYRPARPDGAAEFLLDSVAPRIPFERYAYNEVRYKTLEQTRPQEAAVLLAAAQADVDARWDTYSGLSSRFPAAYARGTRLLPPVPAGQDRG
jgi:pyruvate-ferredoxin/flavodoxin oxidoreductase